MSAPSQTGQRLRFGAFELDVRSRELRKHGVCIRLQEQPFEILRMMLERPGDVVTRDELRQRLWPDGTFVDFEHSLNAAVKRLRSALGDAADNPRFVETLPRRGYRFIASASVERDGPAGAAPRVRLAVLPFTNLSDAEGQDYFTDGLTEEMITQLGTHCRGRIGIVARWSCMTFKGTTERARDIGKVLGADYLLEGGVRRQGERVRITARLIEAAGETHLWAQTYERHLSDVLSVQADVASRIAESLTMELSPGEAAERPGGVTSVTAYQEYLQGRHLWNNWFGPDDERLDQALSRYTEALRIDSNFAPAYAGVARAHIARALNYRERPRAALETARAAAKRSIELESRLSEGRLALADVRRMLEWDWRGAEADYTEAIALNPSQENAHRGFATMLAALGRHVEAVREVDRAVELDPLCLTVGTSAAFVRYLAGDYEGALAYCRRTTDIDPHYLPARRLVGAAYLQSGRTDAAVAVLEAVYAEARHDPVYAASLSTARAMAGDAPGAAELVAALRRLGTSRYVSRYHLALAHLGIGDRDSAFAALEQAVVDSDPALIYLAVEPRFEPIRSDPRYLRLLDLLGLS